MLDLNVPPKHFVAKHGRITYMYWDNCSILYSVCEYIDNAMYWNKCSNFILFVNRHMLIMQCNRKSV